MKEKAWRQLVVRTTVEGWGVKGNRAKGEQGIERTWWRRMKGGGNPSFYQLQKKKEQGKTLHLKSG